MNKLLLSDALNLAQKIQNNLDLNPKFEVVNIYQDQNGKDIKFSGIYYSIVPAFGYTHDKTPRLLEKHGVIEGKAPGWLFVDFVPMKGLWGQTRPEELAMYDGITSVAQERGYTPNDYIAKFYFHIPNDDLGPDLDKRMAVFINCERLNRFIDLCHSLKVSYNKVDRCIEFLGERIPIKSVMEEEAIILLINNINNVVSLGDFNKARNKNAGVVNTNSLNSDAEESSKEAFKRIRKKIKANKKLNQFLTLKESNGFCMEVNEELVERYLTANSSFSS